MFARTTHRTFGRFFTKMEQEIWKDIPGYEGLYQASTDGYIRSLDRKIPMRGGIQTRRGRVLKPIVNIDGYYTVMLCKDGNRRIWRVHQLVAMAFISNPNKYCVVNHKNEIKTDNRACNLEWCDMRYNINYGSRTDIARKTRYERKAGFKPVFQISKLGEILCCYESTADASRKTGIGQGSISNVCSGRTKSAGGFCWQYAACMKVDSKM